MIYRPTYRILNGAFPYILLLVLLNAYIHLELYYAKTQEPDFGEINEIGSDVIAEAAAKHNASLATTQKSERRTPRKRAATNVVKEIYMPSSEACYQTKEIFNAKLTFKKLRLVHFYSAYWDQRGYPDHYVIRLIALHKQTNPLPTIYCHIQNNGSRAISSEEKASAYKMSEDHDAEYSGYLITCKIPATKPKFAPCSVILSPERRYGREVDGKRIDLQLLPVRPLHTEPRQNFSVCVPPLFGDIPQETIAAFVELSQILGAQHFTFYDFAIGRDTQQILKYYVKQGQATVIDWKLPIEAQQVWYHGQLLAINDCLYRNMHAYKYVAFNDLDEFIVPHKYFSWDHMIKQMHKDIADFTDIKPHNYETCGYSFQSAFFDRPNKRGALSGIAYDLRTKKFSAQRRKVMVMPERIHNLGIHHIVKCHPESLLLYDAETTAAFVHHYRACLDDTVVEKNICDAFVTDKQIQVLAPNLKKNVEKVLWLA